MFDQNMFNELSKLKVDRKRKVKEEVINEEFTSNIDNDDYYNDYDEDDTDYYEEDEYDEDDYEDEINNNLQNVTDFINDNLSNKKKLDVKKYIKSDPSNDFATSEKEAKLITIAGRKSIRVLKDLEGKEVKSKYIGEDGNLNVVYHEPGKNIVNRKSIEERRLEVKMEALSDLISKFKTEEDIKEEQKEKVVDLDKPKLTKKELKSLETINYIKDDLDIKISLVLNTFQKLSSFIEKKANLPQMGINISAPDNIRALFSKGAIDEYDTSRIFLLSLFLENPENFPTKDTFEQIEYRNSQVGAKCKTIDLKRMITYISSDSEFNNTIDLVNKIITKDNIDVSGIKDLIDYKCKEVLKTLMIKYLKKDSVDPFNKVNVITIKKDFQLKYRAIESSKSLIESLNNKAKSFPSSMKEQIRKAEEAAKEEEEKLYNLKKDLSKFEREITIMVVLFFSMKNKNGYNLDFTKNLPIDDIINSLKEYNINTESFEVQEIIYRNISESVLNEILKER